MTDERKDEAPTASAEERPKRAGPTIDLEASDVSDDTRSSNDAGAASGDATAEQSTADTRSRASVLSRLAAPVSGALAAVLVFAALWAGGLIGPQPAVSPTVSPAQLDSVAAIVGDLNARVARVEAAKSPSPAAAPDPALARRVEQLERSLGSAGEDLAKLSTQLRAATASLSELRAMPRDGASGPAADPGPLNERLAQLEQATRSLDAALKNRQAADDTNVRRLVVANTLDMAVRRGEPFAAALAAARQVASDASTLGPLDAFAARGIPPEATYLRDIVPVLQRIADAGAAKAKPAETGSAAGPGILDRLQAGAAKLVRIERDAGPQASGATPTRRAEGAISRDDLAAARRDVANLPQASDPQVQVWIKSVDARAAALAAAQKFSAEALEAFGKSGQ